MQRLRVFLPLFLLDTLLIIDAGIIILVLVTGGVVYHVAGIEIGANSTRNFGYALFFFGLIRYKLREALPFLGLPALDLKKLPFTCFMKCVSLYDRLAALNNSQVKKWILVIVIFSALLKLLNAYFYYGFFSGDDVEVHEMTFAHLFAWDWQAWELRNSFFPMVFIYPIQALMHSIGVSETFPLILSGRVVVILFSLVNLWLVYQIGKKWFNSHAVGVLAMFFLATSKLHTSFAASVLPRTVASTFVLLAVLLLFSRSDRTRLTLLAAVCLGIGACIRFSEGIFLLPAVLQLVLEKRYKDVVILCVVFGVTCAAIFGISDAIYWGRPFHSLIYAFKFTIIEGKSTSGLDPLYYYLKKFSTWTNLFVLGLAVLFFRVRRWTFIGWAFIPIFVLSLFPHKEPRYIVPIIPFIAIIAGASFWRLLGNLKKEGGLGAIISKPSYAVMIIAILFGAVLFELDGFRFKRTEREVDIARHIVQQPTLSGAAIEQSWRTGRQLYLWKLPVLKEIFVGNIMDRDYVLKQISDNDVGWAALSKRDIDRYGYGGDLEKLGYNRIRLREKDEKRMYCLYKRSSPY